jgi:general secretion pathway protein C
LSSKGRSALHLPTLFFTLLKLLLIAALAFQCARLFWTIVTPVGPIGSFKGEQGRTSFSFGSIDPFFRSQSSNASTGNVTALALRLFGTRLNSATGQGSAIIATPDGVQSSYASGDVIQPGVKLWSVALDHVVIEHDGKQESLFIDQSVAAPVAQVPLAPTPVPAISSPLSNAAAGAR